MCNVVKHFNAQLINSTVSTSTFQRVHQKADSIHSKLVKAGLTINFICLDGIQTSPLNVVLRLAGGGHGSLCSAMWHWCWHLGTCDQCAGVSWRHTSPLSRHSSPAIYNQLNIYAAPFISRRPGRRSSDGGRRRRKGRVAMSTCQCPPLLSALCALLSSPDIIDGKLYAWHPVLDNK